jgi:hypothetical protein
MSDAKEVNDFHTHSDVDSSWRAQHHTLGTKHDQAASGDHKHDLTQLMAGVTLTGAKGGNVALANLITELSLAFGFTDGTT